MTGLIASSHLIGKILPPVPAGDIVDRPRLDARLRTAAARAVTVLTAGAGFGKSTALAAWAQARNCAWYSVTEEDRDPAVLARGLVASLALRVPGLADDLEHGLRGARGPDVLAVDTAAAFVPTLAAALHARLRSDVHLVIDDLHELDGHGQAVRCVADLCHMTPSRLHVLLASRSDPPFATERLRLHGRVHVLTGTALAFDEAEVAALLTLVGGGRIAAYATGVRELTGGWPAAVRLVADALADADRPDRVFAALVDRGGAVDLVEDLLGREVLPKSAPELVGLLRVAAPLERFDSHLLDALGVADADRIIADARRRGLHVVAAPGDPGWHTLTPITREYALRRLVGGPAEPARVRRLAAGWHLARGDAVTAARYLLQAGDPAGIADLLAAHGRELLAAGQGRLVQQALESLPAAARTPAIDLVEGEAYQVSGDWDRAVSCLSRLIPAAGPAPAAAGWRLGLIYYLRGEPENALGLFRRALDDPGAATTDLAYAAAWAAAASWMAGDAEGCRALAGRAAELAASAGDEGALAAAHTALAMLAALDGDRRANDMHYMRALEHAHRAGDVLQLIRISTNRGSRFLEEGYYAEAIAELDTAVEAAELTGFALLRTLALVNRAEAARALGRLEDAARDLSTALVEQQRLGSRLAGYSLAGLGEVHAVHGNLSLARACYEEAVALAEPSGDLQGLIPALAGLALAVAPDDLDAAAAIADRAVRLGTGLGHTHALICAARIARMRGDEAAAGDYAEAAAAAARERRDRAALAEVLELRAAAQPDPAGRFALLREAEAMWEALGCRVELARTRIELARVVDLDEARRMLDEVERTCRELGARRLLTETARVRAELTSRALPEIGVHTLGGFRVHRRGVPVPHGEWQSRKARDLLKILVARRGAPVPREVLGELLWPDPERADERAHERTPSRLAVTVSTLRAVLDPGRSYPGDRYVASAEGSLRLRREHVDIDVERFLTDAHAALTARPVALDALSRAEARYTGDFCEEDPYADWAAQLREEARASYVSVVRALAAGHAAQGDHETAVRYLLRLLAREPYDEPAHLGLVRELDAGGRHGEARRMYRVYAARMADLEVEPAPYPSGRQAASGGGKVVNLS